MARPGRFSDQYGEELPDIVKDHGDDQQHQSGQAAFLRAAALNAGPARIESVAQLQALTSNPSMHMRSAGPRGFMSSRRVFASESDKPPAEPDVGTKALKFLFSDEAEVAIDASHPRVPLERGSDWTVTKWGKHHCCRTRTDCHCCCRGKRPPSEFLKYGVAVVLHFKFLTFISWMFFIMSLLAAPAAVFYYCGNAFNEDVVTATEVLALFTVGNLGEGTIVHGQAGYGESVTLACDSPTEQIGRVEVFAGRMLGTASCPAYQVPEPECAGRVLKDVCTISAEEEPFSPESYCQFASSRLVKLQPSGWEFYDEACCAASLDNNRPDFSSLDVRFNASSECAANVNPSAIARAECLGNNNCTVTAVADRVHLFEIGPLGPLEQVSAADCPGNYQVFRTDREGNAYYGCWTRFMDPPPRALVSEEDFEAANATTIDVQTCDGSFLWRYEAGRLDTPELVSVDTANPFLDPSTVTSDTVNDDHFRVIVVAQCFDVNVALIGPLEGYTFTKQEIALLVAGFDIIAILVFLLGVAWLSSMEATDQRNSDRFTAANYTVMMWTVPKVGDLATLRHHIKEHFERVLSAEEYINRPLAEKGVRVADINFAMADSSLLRLYIRRGRTLSALDRRIKTLVLAQLAKKSQRKIARRKAWIMREIQRLRRIDKSIDEAEKSDHAAKAVAAYVTFEEDEGRDRATKAFPPATLYWLCQSRDKRLRIDGKATRIAVHSAPEPSDIVWEALEVGTCNRCCRQLITLVITLLVLLMAAVAVFYIEDSKRQAQREFVDADCVALAVESGIPIANKDAVSRDYYWEQLGLTDGNTGRLGCYCQDKFQFSDPTAVFDEQFRAPEVNAQGETQQVLAADETAALCQDWAQTFLTVQGLTYGGALIVLSVNFILRYVLYFIVAFERHHSRTAELLSRAFKLFLLTFLNTAAITMLLNANIDSSKRAFRFLSRGDFRDFSSEWYFTVGVSITITMILNIVVPHFTPIFGYVYTRFAQLRDRSCSCDHTRTKQLTQTEYNKMQMGPDFLLDERYASVFAIIFVTLTFSGGMPLMMPIGWLSFMSTYWVDKYFFTNVYRTPPAYGGEIAHAFTYILPYAALLHMGTAVWMLSNENLFISDNIINEARSAASKVETVTGEASSFGLQVLITEDPSAMEVSQRISQGQTLPIFVLFVVVLVFLVVSRLFLWNLQKLLLFCCPCLRNCCEGHAERYVVEHGANQEEEDEAYARTAAEMEQEEEEERIQAAEEAALPNYFDAISTEVLALAANPENSLVKPELRSRLVAAHRKRTADVRRRRELLAQYKRVLVRAKDVKAQMEQHLAQHRQYAQQHVQDADAAKQLVELQRGLERFREQMVNMEAAVGCAMQEFRENDAAAQMTQGPSGAEGGRAPALVSAGSDVDVHVLADGENPFASPAREAGPGFRDGPAAAPEGGGEPMQGMPQGGGEPMQGMPQGGGEPMQGMPQGGGGPMQGMPQGGGGPMQGVPGAAMAPGAAGGPADFEAELALAQQEARRADLAYRQRQARLSILQTDQRAVRMAVAQEEQAARVAGTKAAADESYAHYLQSYEEYSALSAEAQRLYREAGGRSRQENSFDETAFAGKIMEGLHSYDLHDSGVYRHLFGLDAGVDEKYKRRMKGHALAVPAFARQGSTESWGQPPHQQPQGGQGPALQAAAAHVHGGRGPAPPPVQVVFAGASQGGAAAGPQMQYGAPPMSGAGPPMMGNLTAGGGTPMMAGNPMMGGNPMAVSGPAVGMGGHLAPIREGDTPGASSSAAAASPQAASAPMQPRLGQAWQRPPPAQMSQTPRF